MCASRTWITNVFFSAGMLSVARNMSDLERCQSWHILRYLESFLISISEGAVSYLSSSYIS